MQPLYNRDGRAVAYIADNNISIYLYDGTAAGWIYQESLVFAYSGKFLGWLMYGWLCDPRGNPAFFTDRSTGGPKRAVKQAAPHPRRAHRPAGAATTADAAVATGAHDQVVRDQRRELLRRRPRGSSWRRWTATHHRPKTERQRTP